MGNNRIEKKIHFTWFSNDPFPEEVKKCMDSWQEWLPDYEFIHWDMEKISEIENRFLKEALSKRKWAFAADFVRLYALYHYGGIYLDTDVVVFKTLDPLLHYGAFIGRENSMHLDQRRAVRYLTSHCMGAEKHHPFFKACLDYYKDRPFILSNEEWLPDNLKYDQTTLPEIQYEIAKIQGYNPSEQIKAVQTLENGLKIFPDKYFDYLYKVKKAYVRHLALGGWRNSKKTAFSHNKEIIKRKIYVGITNVGKLLGITIYQNK